MVVKEALRQGTEKLKENKIEEPIRKARLLLADSMHQSKEALMLQDKVEIKKECERTFFIGIQKLVEGIPLQYITNKQSFMKLDLYVDENVLIPQPDTEVLVEETIKIIENKKEKIQVLDLCTGSGAIGISLAKYSEEIQVYASDISNKAIQIAKLNAEKTKVHRKMTFVESNLFDKIEGMTFDVIVSNPPYIKTEVISTLDKEVQKEPILALDGGEDGLFFYREIVKKAHLHLKENGYLCLEIGYDQKESVIELIEKSEKYHEIQSQKDLAGNDRVILAKKVK